MNVEQIPVQCNLRCPAAKTCVDSGREEGGPKIIFRKYLTVTSHCLDCANKFQMCSRMMVLGESEAEAENHRVDQ